MKRSSNTILINTFREENPHGERPQGRPKKRRRDNISRDFNAMGREECQQYITSRIDQNGSKLYPQLRLTQDCDAKRKRTIKHTTVAMDIHCILYI